jgi:hypothetical protein
VEYGETGRIKLERMRFTDKYIALPIVVYDKREDEQNEKLGMDKSEPKLLESTIRIHPFQIDSWFATFNESNMEAPFEKENLTWTSFCSKNGESYMAPMTVEEFEILLNKQTDDEK